MLRFSEEEPYRDMWNKIKYIFLFAAFCCFSLGIYGQDKNNPPEPGTKSHTTTECGEGDGGVTSPPPPVGLCLPINDYLVPLLIAGILLGAYKLRNIETS